MGVKSNNKLKNDFFDFDIIDKEELELNANEIKNEK